jgi:hypothetical protein
MATILALWKGFNYINKLKPRQEWWGSPTIPGKLKRAQERAFAAIVQSSSSSLTTVTVVVAVAVEFELLHFKVKVVVDLSNPVLKVPVAPKCVAFKLPPVIAHEVTSELVVTLQLKIDGLSSSVFEGFAVKDRIFTGCTVTITGDAVAVAVTLPDALLQASVNVVLAVIGGLVKGVVLLPGSPVALKPPGDPEIAQDIAFDVQVSVTDPPLGTLDGLTINEPIFGVDTAFTVTFAVTVAVTPLDALLQASVYRVLAVIGAVVKGVELLPARFVAL